MTFELHIKNMVCDRCIEAVREELSKADIIFDSVALGKALVHAPTKDQLDVLQKGLRQRGFDLLQDSEEKTISLIKTHIITSIKQPDLLQNHNYSTYLEEQIGKDYTTLSRLFSKKTQTTIEKFIIRQRIERVKELLSYGELSISEISNLLNYSSVQALSTQFKKTEGLTPSQYLKQTNPKRTALDDL